jgi:predicted O-methyltransferase YrrM
MAYGYSTLYFLAAGAGRTVHSAIDPLQLTQYYGIAVCNANKAGAHVELIPDWSFKALGKLAESGRRFDVIFIDGGHRFDEVLTDFVMCASVCNPGGYIILDDYWMPSVKTAVAYVKKNRGEFNPVPLPIFRMAAFRKVGEDSRAWNHFKPFPVADRAEWKG